MNAPLKTGLTHAGTAVASAIAATAFLAQHQVDLYAAWDQLNGIVAAITKFIATVTPLATAAYGIYRSTTKNRLAEIANDPKAVEVAKEMPVTPATTALSNALVKSVVLALAVSLSLFMLQPGDASAQGLPKRAVSPMVAAPTAPPPKPCLLPFDPLKLCGVLTGKPSDDIKMVADRIRLADSNDIDYAIAKATAAKTPASQVRLTCLNAIKVAHDQASGSTVKHADGSDWPRPDPALLTTIEDVSELVDNLSPQGPLFTACAGVAQMFKTNILTAVNAFVTGAAAIAAAPVGL